MARIESLFIILHFINAIYAGFEVSKWLVSGMKVDENGEEHDGDSNQPRQWRTREKIRNSSRDAYTHTHTCVHA